MRIRNVFGFCVSLAAASLMAAAPYESLGETKSAAMTPPGNRYAELARLPDWSGVWFISEPTFLEAFIAETNPKNPRAPALTPLNRAKLEAYNVRSRTGQDPPGAEPLRTNPERCLPAGMPAVMVAPIATEYLFTPGRVTVVSEDGPTVRRIYTDSKLPPRDEREGTFAGTSVGHWEGQTLIVETSAISSRSQLIATVATSGKAHVTERIYLKDPKHLRIDTVVDDPGVLTSPWSYSRTYQRLDSGPGMREDFCEDNREPNGGEPDLALPK